MLPAKNEENETTALSAATFVERVVAAIIDAAVITFFHFSFFIVLGFLLWSDPPAGLHSLLQASLSYFLLFFAALPILAMIYLIILHAYGGQTIGKIFMGIQVRPLDNGSMSTGISFLRWTGYFISLLPLAAGFLWIILDKRGQAWHDKLAGTWVEAL